MKRFPLFLDLTGRKAVVVGGGTVGLRRAAVLADFGALVTVVDPGPAESAPAGLTYLSRPYETGDLAGAFLAVAATDAPAVNAAVGSEARARGILFNRSDDPSDCDFFFPAICEGERLVAGLVGDGTDHAAVAQAARRVRQALTEYEDKESKR
jgi:siroheme synthase-like protein